MRWVSVEVPSSCSASRGSLLARGQLSRLCWLLLRRADAPTDLLPPQTACPCRHPSTDRRPTHHPIPSLPPRPAQCLFMDLLCLLRPDYLSQLIAVRGVAPLADGGDVQAFYRQAAASLRLTPGQRRGLLAEWRSFQARQAELASAVSAAASGAAGAAGTAAGQPQGAANGLPDEFAAPAPAVGAAAAAAARGAEAGLASSMAAQAEQCMLLVQRAGALAAAAEAHWAALLAFHDTAWYMLTPLQGARLAVACRGSYPDPIQLVVAVEQLEAEAAGRAQLEASCSQPPQLQLQAAEEGQDGGESEAAAAIRAWQDQAAKQLSGDGDAPGGQFSAALLKLASSQ